MAAQAAVTTHCMFRFAHPEYLYLLLLLPLLAVFFLYGERKRKTAGNLFASSRMMAHLAASASPFKRAVKFLLLMLAAASLIVAIANPQVGTRMEDVKQEGIDIFIALDVSLSMKAEDVKPNRLEKAKYEIRNLIGRLAGDRIGLIIFSGEAYTQFPLTTDYSAANLFLDAVDVESVPQPGTAIGEAVQQAMRSFNFDDPTAKVLVIITDGENNEGDAVAQSEDAAKKGVLVYAIGMGSPEGAMIPVYDASGRMQDFKRDRSGNPVMTKLDEATLQKIAGLGGGKYYRATNSQDELDEIYRNINVLQKREFGTKRFTDFEDKFQYFLLFGIIVLAAEVMTTDKKLPWLEKINPFKRLQ
jgi:Ca-activated chloride channel homolog